MLPNTTMRRAARSRAKAASVASAPLIDAL